MLIHILVKYQLLEISSLIESGTLGHRNGRSLEIMFTVPVKGPFTYYP